MKQVVTPLDIPSEDLRALYVRWTMLAPRGVLPPHTRMKDKEFLGEAAAHCKQVSRLADGRFRYDGVGTAIQRLYDVEILGKHIDELFDPWIRKIVLKAYDHAVQNGAAVYQRKGFSTVFGQIGYEMVILPFVDENGAANYFVTCVFPLNRELKKFSDWKKKITLTPWLNSGD